MAVADHCPLLRKLTFIWVIDAKVNDITFVAGYVMISYKKESLQRCGRTVEQIKSSSNRLTKKKNSKNPQKRRTHVLSFHNNKKEHSNHFIFSTSFTLPQNCHQN